VRDKINAPPAVIDFQEMPKSVERILKINKAIKDGTIPLKKKRRKKKKTDWLINTDVLEGKEVKLRGMTRPEKSVPSFVQQPGETDEHFLHRLGQACHNVIQEAQFEQKFGVNLNVNHETGEVSITKKEKDELDDLEKPPAKKHKTQMGTSKKKEKRKQKEKEVKIKKMEMKNDGFEKLYDNVKFGEVVHAPPSLKALPKKATSTDRPGKKDLLLKSVVKTNTSSQKQVTYLETFNKLSEVKVLSGPLCICTVGDKADIIPVVQLLATSECHV
ncbi:hypothetical protein L9F63_012355, partial [Diploptera punctata]